MGALDTEARKYLSRKEIFADAFNYLLFDGEEVIRPEELPEMDTAGIAVPYGNRARLPVQMYRDAMKLWSAMTDDRAIYVILGSEYQGKVHYGMPVKDALYDMIGYSKQIEESRRSYRAGKGTPEDAGKAGLALDKGVLKIRLTDEEFLSGLRRGIN